MEFSHNFCGKCMMKVWNRVHLQIQIRGLPCWLLDSFTVGVWERPPGCFGHRLVAIAHGGAAGGGRRRGMLGFGVCFSSEAVTETAGDGEEEVVSGSSIGVVSSGGGDARTYRTQPPSGGETSGCTGCGRVSEGPAGGVHEGGAGVSGPRSDGAEEGRWPDPHR